MVRVFRLMVLREAHWLALDFREVVNPKCKQHFADWTDCQVDGLDKMKIDWADGAE